MKKQCQYCDKCFEGKAMGGHVASAHRIKTKKHCPTCNKEFLLLGLHRCKGVPKQQTGFCNKCNSVIKQRFYCHVEKCTGNRGGEYKHKTIYRGHGWNKGLTKETSNNVKQFVETRAKNFLLGIYPSRKGEKRAQKTKDKISNGMKKAHAEGRANEWKPNTSYAQQFFEKFLINNGYIKNKDFFCEFRFNKYSLDFFFPNKSLDVEIDGQQHYRDVIIVEKDKIRDAFLKDKKLKTLRIPWKVVCHNTKNELNSIKTIIETYNEQYDLTLYTNNQLKKLKFIDELKKRRPSRKPRLSRRLSSEQIEIYKQGFNGIDFSKFGWVTKLSNIWNVSHSQVRRRMIKYFKTEYETAYHKLTT